MGNDFSPEGYYGKQKQSLQEALEDKGTGAKAIADVIGILSTALKMIPTPVYQGLADLLHPREQAIGEQLKTIELFFQILEDKINYAKKIAAEVMMLLLLLSLSYDANMTKQLLLFADPNLRDHIIRKLNDMGHQCYEYVIWHGYGSSA
ncbi:hypothetical protein KR074_004314 [Drosophila pseudoananassae]|nr:hypothetical protein KR074_004314 [Drosophila pseudoananassae]